MTMRGSFMGTGRIWRTGILTILGMVSMLSAPASAQAADCTALSEQGYSAYQRQDFERLEALLRFAPTCPDEAFLLATWNASLWWNEALRLYQAGASQAAQEATLRRVLDFAPLWQAHAALGDFASTRNDHTEATRHYQAALDSINSPALTPAEPPAATIGELFRKAQASRLLAPVYVPTSRSRSGTPSGLASTAFRSFGVREVAIPVQFHFDSVEFTEKGRAAAADLLDYLERQGMPAITLIGHADPMGDPEYNRELSLRRAQAVADRLRTQGYSGEVRVEGRGYDEPFQVDDPGRYSLAELHQLHRRVELRRQ